jgi:hypothetical protein
MTLLVRVKLTEVVAASDAACIVTWPLGRFNTTAVDLLVACVTLPPGLDLSLAIGLSSSNEKAAPKDRQRSFRKMAGKPKPPRHR